MVEKRNRFGRIIKRFRNQQESHYARERGVIRARFEDSFNSAASQGERLDVLNKAKADFFALTVETFDQETNPEERPHTIEILEARCEELRIRFQRRGKEADRSTYIGYARLIQGLRDKWFPPAQQ